MPRSIHSSASRWPGILRALILATGPFAVPALPQTDEEVRQAVADCIGLASQNDVARENLQRWGDAALPALERMAAAPGSASNHHLVVAIADVRTRAAADLLLTLAERNEPSLHDHALDNLMRMARSSHSATLVDVDRFKRAVVAKMESSRSWFELRNVVETIAELGWKDQAAVVRGLLDHSNLDVRRAAAEAIRKLTGEIVTIEEPGLVFPRDIRVEGAIEEIGAVSRAPASRGAVTFISRGTAIEDQLVLFVSEDETVFIDSRLEAVDDLPIRVDARQCLLVPTESGEQQVVIRTGEFQQHSFASEVLAYDLSGAVRWRYGDDGEDVESMAPLFHDGEILGLVLGFGGERSVVALDLSGSVLWTVPRLYVVYEVRTHRDLPSHVGIAGGFVYVVDALGRQLGPPPRGLAAMMPDWAVRSKPLWNAEPYASHAAIFPDAERRVAGIVAGSGQDSVETICRWDHAGRMVWSATLPQDVCGLCTVDAPGGRCFAVVTEDWRLVLFDEDGGLLADTQLEAPRWGSNLVDVQAGRLQNDVAIALTSLQGTTLYRVEL